MPSSSTVSSLQQRIVAMQSLRLDDRALPTAPALAPLLPGGALRGGASYVVQGSVQLALAFLSAASASGSWCGVIGLPDLGVEAAAESGISLDRCVLIPHPGDRGVNLAGSMSEILTVVLLRSTGAVHPAEAERVSARLREHDSALVVIGDWPRPETRLRVSGSQWSGLGDGHGSLVRRELTVHSQDRRGTRSHVIRFDRGSPVPPSAPEISRAPESGRPPARRLVAL